MGVIGISFILRIALFAAYEIYFVSSRGATPGKMALGVKVIRADGGPVSAGLATGRFFGLFLSQFILYTGYIMAGFDPKNVPYTTVSARLALSIRASTETAP